MAQNFIIFDVETNGVYPEHDSVLSFSGLRVNTWREDEWRAFEVEEVFDRYYYAVEPYTDQAIAVNGLTPDVIGEKRRRSTIDYPFYFPEDQDVADFCRQTSRAIAHNAPFDVKFLKQAHNCTFDNVLCTMRQFTDYCAIPHPKFGMKWPRLEEAVQIICGDNDFDFHDSLADCYAVLEMVKEMTRGNQDGMQAACADVLDRFFDAGW